MLAPSRPGFKGGRVMDQQSATYAVDVTELEAAALLAFLRKVKLQGGPLAEAAEYLHWVVDMPLIVEVHDDALDVVLAEFVRNVRARGEE